MPEAQPHSSCTESRIESSISGSAVEATKSEEEITPSFSIVISDRFDQKLRAFNQHHEAEYVVSARPLPPGEATPLGESIVF
jgi:hypothetical protein